MLGLERLHTEASSMSQTRLDRPRILRPAPSTRAVRSSSGDPASDFGLPVVELSLELRRRHVAFVPQGRDGSVLVSLDHDPVPFRSRFGETELLLFDAGSRTWIEV